MSGARLSSIRKGSAVGSALGSVRASIRAETGLLTVVMRPLGRQPAGLRGGGAAEPDGLQDLLELACVVVPVVVVHGAQEHVDRDLVRAHELLEEGDASLALVEFPLFEPVDIVEQAAALGVQRVPELGERHLPALVVEEGGSGVNLDQGVAALREARERSRRVEARLEEEVREHLTRGPLARGVGTLHVGVHAVELAAQVLPRPVDPSPKVMRMLAGHEFLLPRGRRAAADDGLGPLHIPHSARGPWRVNSTAAGVTAGRAPARRALGGPIAGSLAISRRTESSCGLAPGSLRGSATVYGEARCWQLWGPAP